MKNFQAKVIAHRKIAKDIFELEFACPNEALELFSPGQFVQVKIPDAPDKILRRPFGISSVDIAKGTATIVYQIAGQGTKQLSQTDAKVLDVLMPLGHGFPNGYKNVLLVGGGIGIAPLRSVAEQMPDTVFDAILGYKSEEYVYGTDAFNKTCRKVWLVTDDGSARTKGFVTDIVKTLDLKDYDAVFACGPRPMLAALKACTAESKTPVFASLEERMGCGMGGCAVCVCKTRDDAGAVHYKKVCTEGPVLDIREVDFT